MTQRRRNEHAVQRHLGHPVTEVMAVFTDIVGNPRREELLQGRQHTGRQHLGPQRVRLKLAQVHLSHTKHSCQSFFFPSSLFFSFLSQFNQKTPAEGSIHTAMYPVCDLPPVRWSPNRCASSLLSWRNDGCISSANLTDIVYRAGS